MSYRRGEIISSCIAERNWKNAGSPVPVEIDPLSLPSLQQAALLAMRESQVSRTVIRRLTAESQARPDGGDYAALEKLGLCRRNVGKRVHELTASGGIAAATLEMKLCNRFAIHLLMQRGRASGPTARFFCPCGWSVEVRNSPTAPGNAHAQFRTHLYTVKRLGGLVDALKPMRAEGI